MKEIIQESEYHTNHELNYKRLKTEKDYSIEQSFFLIGLYSLCYLFRLYDHFPACRIVIGFKRVEINAFG